MEYTGGVDPEPSASADAVGQVIVNHMPGVKKAAPVWRVKRGSMPYFINTLWCRRGGWTLSVSEHVAFPAFHGNGQFSFFAEKGTACFNSAWPEINRVFRSADAAQRDAVKWVDEGANGASL